MRVSLVCLPAAAVLEPQRGRSIGGTETRAWLLARTLARQPDTDVQFIVRDDEPLSSPREGVQIVTHLDRVFQLYEQVGMCVARTSRFPYLRLKQWRPSLLWTFPAAVVHRLLKSPADPREPQPWLMSQTCDLFCTFGVQSTSATVIASAHATGRKAVLALGSDGDLDERFLTDPDYINPYGDRSPVCRFILEQADAIVCQTVEQQQMLKERFGREGTVILNPLDLADWDRKAVTAKRPASPSVLWVGRAEAIHKRPMSAIEIARLCPDIPFTLVMNPRDPVEEERVRNAAPDNVRIVPLVPPDEMPALMSSSLALLNTSSLEGFPNTFLQAGASRIPVVSLEVADEFLARSESGVYCGGDPELAARALHQYACHHDQARIAGEKGRAWVQAHHDADGRAAELREVFRSVLDSVSPSGRTG